MQHTDHATLNASEQLVVAAAAAAAPSVFNTQPWSFVFTDAGMEVHADPHDASMPTASAARDVRLSCGAAVFNARVALARRGHGSRVSVFPDEGDPLLVARVAVTDDAPDRALDELYRWLGSRRTNRYPFRPEGIPAAVLALLHDAARREGATLRLLEGEPEYQRMLTSIRHATWAEDDAVREDRGARLSPSARPPAIPVGNLGPVPRPGRPDDAPVRDMAQGLDLPGRGSAAFEPHPDLAVLETADDDPGAWIAAGQALQRLLLEATGHGIAASFANQPLEDAELRPDVASGAAHFGHPQMVLRLGYATQQPPIPPRRPLSQVIRESGAA
ncbi:Acg family FMN-binding oxidoreductase [Streptomyces sp. NPDC057287]|uniref:Acg family FMN-binding oxidoreductase n=1 Tax=Streptomyces sp. NPDC057287 TaxID=3346086 RepID=UPI0036422442